MKLRTSSSHEEGCSRDWSVATKEFIGEKGKLKALKVVRLEWKDGKMSEIPGSEFIVKADLVFLAMGFVSPVGGVLDAFGVAKDARGNARRRPTARAATRRTSTRSSPPATCAAASRWSCGRSARARQCARAVDEFLMGTSTLPRWRRDCIADKGGRGRPCFFRARRAAC
jgi:glutamate synthase (NADPH/NADH) small chain